MDFETFKARCEAQHKEWKANFRQGPSGREQKALNAALDRISNTDWHSILSQPAKSFQRFSEETDVDPAPFSMAAE